ncbi:MAG: CARDB domain-containing protein, partial [Candidatus Poseidoniaceae archaeon]|nr:CARDB domain-containing protein [Candidatus Poseidoniaceae archaeon]
IITATNLGWLGLSKSGESDDYGMWDLEIPERIIELEDSTGQHWQEEAKIQATYNGAWGNFSTGIIDLDSTNHSYFHLNFSLPELSVDSITFDKTEQSVGSPVSATATVTNSGASAENVTLDCVLSGNSSDARISPAYPTVDVPSGETVEVSFTWREASTGESTLTCSILSPNGIYLNHEDLATSPKVEWQELFDASDGNTIVWVLMLSMGIGILLAAFIAIRQMNAIDEEADEEADEDEKDYAEIED